MSLSTGLCMGSREGSFDPGESMICEYWDNVVIKISRTSAGFLLV